MSARFNDPEILQATHATKSRVGKALSYESVCTDTRQLTEGCLFVALKGDRYDAHDFLDEAVRAGAGGLVVNEGRAALLREQNVNVYEVKDTLFALGRLARFHRDRFNIPLCAVTGSNGKTTVKELVASILSMRGPTLKTHGNLNNEIGVPLTLFGLDQTHVAAVVEMGMNHLGEIARLTEIARPDAGLITVVQPAHLEGVGSIEGVAKAKAELFHGLGRASIAVVNLDDHRIANEASSVSSKKLTWGRAAEADVRLLWVEPRGRDGLFLRIGYGGKEYATALNLVGDHNAMNATGAFALAIALGYSPEECVRGLEAAQSHARRLQILDAPNGVMVIDDCYNANPASMNAALRTLQELSSRGRAVAVLGDMLELGSAEANEHTQLGIAASDHVSVLALFGPRTKQAHAQAVKKLGAKAKHFEDVGELVAWLRQELLPNDCVLVKGSRGMRLERVVEALTGTSQGGGH